MNWDNLLKQFYNNELKAAIDENFGMYFGTLLEFEDVVVIGQTEEEVREGLYEAAIELFEEHFGHSILPEQKPDLDVINE